MISLGIDTSCYTTSLVVMKDTEVLYEGRRLLTVKKGTVGLRQADAFFQHVQNLPVLYQELCQVVAINTVEKIVVSDKPRPVLDSYMPVFTAGIRFAEVIALTLSIPLVKLSHQENHLYAGLLETAIDGNFLGVHISGGTSEILAVDSDFNISIIGDTLDISFGKLIDRLGVYMGYDFPCGKALDKLTSESTYKLKYAVKGTSFNLSGVENKLKNFYDEDKDASKVAVTLFLYISNLLIMVIDKGMMDTGYHKIIMSGGVSANTTIRNILKSYYKDNIIFTSIAYATDHAIGNAYYGNVVMTY